MCIILVNCHILLELSETLPALEAGRVARPSPLDQARLCQVSSQTPYLGMDSPAIRVTGREAYIAKEPESNNTVSLRPAREWTISNRGCYYDIKVSALRTRGWSSGVGSSSMQRKLSGEQQPRRGFPSVSAGCVQAPMTTWPPVAICSYAWKPNSRGHRALPWDSFRNSLSFLPLPLNDGIKGMDYDAQLNFNFNFFVYGHFTCR